MVEKTFLVRLLRGACFINCEGAFVGSDQGCARFVTDLILDDRSSGLRPQVARRFRQLQMRGTLKNGAPTNCERAEEQVERRAHHLDEVAAVGNLLPEIGKRTEGVDEFWVFDSISENPVFGFRS